MSGEDPFDTTPSSAVSTAVKIQQTPSNFISDEMIRNKLFKQSNSKPKLCMLLKGKRGSGKSGAVMNYLTEQDIKDGHKIVWLDIDNCADDVRTSYHLDKVNNILMFNPVSESIDEDGQIITDYKQTLNWVRSTIKWVKDNHQKEKIKAICFDGLSPFLNHAENIMRIEKHIDASGGVSTAYWKLRAKIFYETLEQIKAIPIDKFFIGHEDFMETVGKDGKVIAVKERANQMVSQSVICERIETLDKIVFKVKVDKSRTNIALEGKSIDFAEVEKTTGKAVWNGRKVLELFM